MRSFVDTNGKILLYRDDSNDDSPVAVMTVHDAIVFLARFTQSLKLAARFR